MFLYNTPLTQETQDAQLRRLRAGSRELRARHAEPRPALVVLRRQRSRRRPAAAASGSRCTSYPEIDPGYSWNTLAPRTGVVFKLTEDGKNVAKASYSRYYESMIPRASATASTANSHPDHAACDDLRRALGDAATATATATATSSATLKSQFVAKSNAIDPNLKDPKNDEIMFAFQRELASNWSLNVDWIQRWFNDARRSTRTATACPATRRRSTAYAPDARRAPIPGPTTSAAPATIAR